VTRFLFLNLLLLLVTMSLSAQSLQAHGPHDMSTMQAPNEVIDGAKTPELIPDETAYRMFLVVASEPLDASPQRKARQRAVLGPMQLSDKEYSAAVEVLAKFKAQYNAMIEHYNKSVEEANAAGRSTDIASFRAQLDALVQATRQGLAAKLAPDTMTRFHAHVQGEKRFMKVPKEVK
jgi:hypothetical protein